MYAYRTYIFIGIHQSKRYRTLPTTKTPRTHARIQVPPIQLLTATDPKSPQLLEIPPPHMRAALARSPGLRPCIYHPHQHKQTDLRIPARPDMEADPSAHAHIHSHAAVPRTCAELVMGPKSAPVRAPCPNPGARQPTTPAHATPAPTVPATQPLPPV